MVENAGDDPFDRKLIVYDYFVEIKALKKVEAPIKVEASSVNSGVFKLRDNKMDRSHFFSSRETWKDKDEFLGWVF